MLGYEPSWFLIWVGVGWLPVLCRWRSQPVPPRQHSQNPLPKKWVCSLLARSQLDQTGAEQKITVGPVLVVTLV